VIFGTRVFVVVPAYREAARLPRVLATMPAEVDHVVVVDDASDDGTLEAASSSGDPRVVALRHDRNRGVGAAIATGYRRALATSGDARDAFVVMAGDGQMDPTDLPALVAPVARGAADYVKGDRFAHPDAASIPWTRRAGGRVMSALTRAAIARPLHDSQCGYTAMSRAACERLDLDALWPRFGYPNDLLAMLARAGARIVEVPVRPVYHAHTHNKLGARHVPVIAAVVFRAWLRRKGSREPNQPSTRTRDA
jgi:glycosyltransferase involved in cell wall biosynthesis